MTVLLHRIANKYLERLNSDDKARFYTAFEALEKEPPEGDIKPYTGNPGISRLRVGNFRALFKIEDNKILITHIESRGQTYTKKTRSKRG